MMIALLATTLTACKASSYQSVPRPLATAAVPEGTCRVYVARSDQLWGKVRSVEVVDEGSEIGSIGVDGYLCWEREPGREPIQVLYHGPILDGGVVEGLLDFNGAAGSTYYYAVHLRDTDRKPEIKLLDSAEWAALIAERSPAPVR